MAQHDDRDENKTYQRQMRTAAQQSQNTDEALRALLSVPNGRDFLWWLLDIGRIGLQPFTGVAASTDFNCGQLNVGQQILARILAVAPEGYLTMLKERQNVERTSSD